MRRIGALAVGFLMAGILAPVTADQAEASTCLHLGVTNVECEIIPGESGGGTTTSSIVRSGDVSGASDMAWSIGLCIPQCLDVTSRELEDLQAARDSATYTNRWHLIYEGNTGCWQKEKLGTWYADGIYYLIHHAWSLQGYVSSGSGMRNGNAADAVAHGYATMSKVHVEGQFQADCNADLQLARQSVETANVAQGQTTFGSWKPTDPGVSGTATWTLGGVATCVTGLVTSGVTPKSGPVSFTSSGGNLASVNMAFVNSEWEGQGQGNLCINISG